MAKPLQIEEEDLNVQLCKKQSISFLGSVFTGLCPLNGFNYIYTYNGTSIVCPTSCPWLLDLLMLQIPSCGGLVSGGKVQFLLKSRLDPFLEPSSTINNEGNRGSLCWGSNSQPTDQDKANCIQKRNSLMFKKSKLHTNIDL